MSRLYATFFALAFVFAACAPAIAAPPVEAQPPAELLARARSFVALTQGLNAAKLDELITPDAVVVDEVPPFRWSGPQAASQWIGAVHAFLTAEQVTSFTATAGKPVEYQQSGDAAYLILPVTLVATVKTKSTRETGTMTFTFRRLAGEWMVSTVTWTTATMSP